ncbi:HAD family hydrolase [Deinococcus ruber]|uniref:Hydrolase n=1 Tax=Deinococcus ruber TaxID=1848197 RepID=A0A918F6Z6_9DEIO|nr:HAD family hydrolase [Deinococcus ruber]GGR07198.1 hydrolase [Deinococcus ruber]
MTPAAIIFDLDDTLFDDLGSTRAGLAGLGRLHPGFAALHPDDLLSRHAAAIAAREAQVYAGTLTPQQARIQRFEYLLADLGISEISGEAAAQQYREAYRAAYSLNGGVLELVHAIRERGVKLAVLTNYAREVQQEKLKRVGLTPLVDALLTYDETPPKPDPRSYRAACEALNVTPAQATMVGDHWLNDVSGAVAAGLRAVWYNPRQLPAPETVPHTSLSSFLPLDRALQVLLG